MNLIGIYQIFNTVNEEMYIGSSVNIKRRFRIHLRHLETSQHCNIHLQRAWDKYGKDSFLFLPLEYCTSKELIEKEQKWIDYLKPIYNILKIANSSKGYLHTIETKLKMKEIWMQKSNEEKELERKRLSSIRKGVKISKEHLDKLINGLRKAKIWQRPESIERMRLHKINNTLRISKPVLQFSKDGVFIKEFPSIKVAGESLGLRQSQYSKISAVCLGRQGRKQCQGFIWKHKNIENVPVIPQ